MSQTQNSHSSPDRRVSFRTFGCRLNQAETAGMIGSFLDAGYGVVPFGEPCSVCVIHSCSVTAAAETESLRTARSIKRRGIATRIVLAGCVAETAAPEPLLDSGIDLVVGQRDKWRIPALLGGPTPSATPPLPRFDTTRALLRVQDGCDFFCSYCIVPFARGRAVSRPWNAILDEARQLAECGFQEFVVTGANVGMYRDGGRRLVDLLAALETMSGIRRLRLSSIELSTTESDLLGFMRSSRTLCRQLHIPLQSGDDGILRAMGRRYSSLAYRQFVQEAVEHIPDLGLGTDILVGFPGETEEAFSHTLQLVDELPFSNLHVFPYSPRRRTKAAALPDRVQNAVAQDRVAAVISRVSPKREAFARRFIGRPIEVLVESVEPGAGEGWSGEYLPVRVLAAGLSPNTLLTATPTVWNGEQLVARPA